MEEKQTPLIELLEDVPRDTVLVVEHDQFSSSFHPVGRLCHEAAAELRRLHALTTQGEAMLRQALDALAYWLEYGETPGSHDIIQRTHDVLRERLK
jgi:hypothetical protein